jgi:regulator of RNase E activity RraB
MSTERLIKWSNKSKSFLEKASYKNLEVTFMVSQANETQTGEGFEEFVNTVNSLRDKIKEIKIIDTKTINTMILLEMFLM